MEKKEGNGKRAILVVSFGTGGEAGMRSIEAVEQAVAEAFPDCGVRRAFTSRFIINKLKRQGEAIDGVTEAVERLLSDGVKELVIQPTHVMSGYEYDKLRELASPYEDRFLFVGYGGPLLARESDCKTLVQVLVEETGNENSGKNAVVCMGHGTGHAANAVYARLNGCLEEAGYSDYYIGTMESAPSLEDVLRELRGGRYGRVLLLPLLITAGEHALRDMAGEGENSWKNRFRAEGYETDCVLKGLGEYPGVQKMFVEHVRRAWEERDKRSGGLTESPVITSARSARHSDGVTVTLDQK